MKTAYMLDGNFSEKQGLEEMENLINPLRQTVSYLPWLLFHACLLSHFSHSQLFETLQNVARQALLSRDSSGKNTGVGCPVLLQEIFLTQGLNLHPFCFLHCRQILYHLSHQGSPFYFTLLLLSRFSRVQLCATPQTAAHQAPPSLGFSRQEHWSGFVYNFAVNLVGKFKEISQFTQILKPSKTMWDFQAQKPFWTPVFL